MEKKEIIISYSVYQQSDELDVVEADMVKSAIEATESSYSPYSKFAVGAAVRLANGKIIKGSNQENGAYPSGLCAERIAIFAAASQYPGVAIDSISITAKSEGKSQDEPVVPCGACRQVMIEYENLQNSPMQIILHGESDKCFVINNAASLLPLSFSGDFLKKK